MHTWYWCSEHQSEPETTSSPPIGRPGSCFQWCLCWAEINNSIVSTSIKAVLTICWPHLGQSLALGSFLMTRKRVQGACRCSVRGTKGLRKPVYWSVEWGQRLNSPNGAPRALLFGDLNREHIVKWILKDSNGFSFRSRVTPLGKGSINASFIRVKADTDSTWMFNYRLNLILCTTFIYIFFWIKKNQPIFFFLKQLLIKYDKIHKWMCAIL